MDLYREKEYNNNLKSMILSGIQSSDSYRETFPVSPCTKLI